MNLRLSSWSKLALALAVAGASVLVSDQAQASNMGFKMNKVIDPLGTPAPKGQNWVALPYRNPYQTAQDVCGALGLSNVAPKGVIRLINAQTGTTNSHNCGDLGPFAVPKPFTNVGLVVTNNTAAGGIIVGSHAGNPPAPLTLHQTATPSPRGQNYFSVPYHTTAVTAEDLCVDLGLPATTGRVQRRIASTGVTQSHNCTQLGPFNLVLGEAVVITFPGAAPIVVAAGHPAHF
jgi:hypothetical protein